MQSAETSLDLRALPFSQQVDRLRALLFQESGDVYVFVDPLLHQPFDRAPTARADEHLIALGDRGIGEERFPYFRLIPSSTDAMLEDSYALALAEEREEDVRSVCGWFSTSFPPRQLKELLRSEADRRGTQRWLFRFFDPRVLRHLPRVMEHGYAIPGAIRWYYLDEGLLKSVPGKTGLSSRKQITQRDFLHISRLGLVNQAHRMWKSMEDDLPSDPFAVLYSAAEKAVGVGLSPEDEADCIAFMLHRCMIHPEIEFHPEIATWISAARDGRMSYADAAAQAPSELWHRIELGDWIQDKQGAQHG